MPTRTHDNNGPSTRKKKQRTEERPASAAAISAPRVAARQPQPKANPPKQAFVVRVSAKSAAKAKTAFKNFSLSKFSGGAPAANFVRAGQNVTTFRRQHISNQLTQLEAGPTRTLTIAMPPAMLKKLLPSYDPRIGTVNLDEVMDALEQNMRGTEFYANGNPTLNRLDIQTRARDLIQSVIEGAKK